MTVKKGVETPQEVGTAHAVHYHLAFAQGFVLEASLITAADFLASHGYVVIFVWVFLDQAALPMPSIPVLVAAGALVATGALDLTGVIVTASVAALLADALWYQLGHRGGEKAITYVCKLSLEPDSCVTTTRNAFGRFGPVTIVIAKYLPGVQTLAPASAGFVGAPFAGFLLLDMLGTLLYVVPFVVGGYLFQPQLLTAINSLGDIGTGLGLLLVIGIAIYVGYKAVQWLTFFRGHRLRRLTAEELQSRRERGEELTVIDLRQRLDYELQPLVIPGALRIPITEIPRRREEVPDHLDVALVCT
ncbi:MAG: VTT domain-containing protein [Pseudomonadales bacterium]